MTQLQLTRLCHLWQRRLRLQDWDVSVELVPRHQIDCDGVTNYNYPLKTANIRVCSDPSVHGGYGGQPYDVEQILVHELLHLQFPTIGAAKEQPEYNIMEQGIDHTAWALIHAVRS